MAHLVDRSPGLSNYSRTSLLRTPLGLTNTVFNCEGILITEVKLKGNDQFGTEVSACDGLPGLRILRQYSEPLYSIQLLFLERMLLPFPF
jgi:hypothetical protein